MIHLPHGFSADVMHLQVALAWCLVLQEAMMWQAWPNVALKYHPFREERDATGQFVFRGPRCVHIHCTGVGVRQGYVQQLLRLSACTPWTKLARPHCAAQCACTLLVCAAPLSPHAFASNCPTTTHSRLKVGVSEGRPEAVLPDHMGRADYTGYSINQVGRLC